MDFWGEGLQNLIFADKGEIAEGKDKMPVTFFFQYSRNKLHSTL